MLRIATISAVLALPCLLAGSTGGIVLVPAKLPQGDAASLTVTTVDLRTGAPAGGVPIRVELRSADGSIVLPLFEGNTLADGSALVKFTVPRSFQGPAEVVVTTPEETFKAQTTITRGPVVLIETDKPLYQPGQTIQGRVLLLNNALAPQSGEVEIVITDGKGIRVFRKTLEVNEFGAAAFRLPLARELNQGRWTITATAGDSRTSLSVQVDRYVLPQFSVDVAFEKDWFLPDEEIKGTVESRYFFGKNVQGEATITAERYVGVWEQYAEVTVPVVDGAAVFALPPVQYVTGTPGDKGDSAVNITVKVTDTGAHSEATTRVVKIANAPVEVRLIAQEQSIEPGFDFSFLVVTETPSGVPQDREVELTITFRGDEGVLEEINDKVRTQGGEILAQYKVPEKALSANVEARLQEGDHVSTAYLNVLSSYSPTASFLHLSRAQTDEVPVGGEVVVEATTTHGGTLFWEVLAAGRVLAVGATSGRRINFTATYDMLPKIRVVGYVLNPGNELACDTLEVPVALSSPLELDVSFSTEEARPGEEVILSINAHRKSLIGLSLVDSSLQYLAGERLTLRNLFEDLEKRYMEPQAEVHEGDVWSPVLIPGPKDLLASAGLSIGTSEAISVPEGRQADPWLRWRIGVEPWLEEGVLPPFADVDLAGGTNGLAEVKRVRQFFPETWLWEPLLLTDEHGRAQLTLTCPDTITTWNLRAVANSASGLALAEADIKVFQEFFVEPDIPVEVVRNEVFPVKLRIFNYESEPQDIFLQLQPASWFELEGEPQGSVSVGPNDVTAFTVKIRPIAVGTFPLEVTARGPLSADAVVRKVRVVPEGIPVTTVENGVLLAGDRKSFSLDFPPETVPDSGIITVAITPSIVAQGMGNLDDLLGMPYGCGEQNMIFFAPDVEVLRYLQATGDVQPEIRATAEHYINVGYQRQLTFRRSDGSFSAFGEQDPEGSTYLTAFVLSTFAGARDIRDVDPGVLASAAGYLVDHQEADGSWHPEGFLHHQELRGGLEGDYALTAYVAKALAEYDPQATSSALGAARAYLAGHRTEVADKSYPLAVAAYALSMIPGAQQDLSTTLDLLLELAQNGETGIHWEPYPVETTAYAALALIAAGRPEAASAIDFLVSRRGALGGFGSTQDTVMAFRALTRAALQARRGVEGSIEVAVDGKPVHTFTVNASNYDILQTTELPAGKQALLSFEGTGKVTYQIVRRYNVPGESVPPQRTMLITVDYDTQHVSVDDLLDVHVTLTYTGLRERTNMVIADVGVPTGFEPVQESLDALIEGKKVERIERAVRKIIFYVSELTRGEPLKFDFQVRALFPIRAAPAPSIAYDYYEPDEKGIDPGTGLTIGASVFLRGDANGDGARDISDAVSILQYLFGGSELDCPDAADTNDDGVLNIADPIFLLGYLFAGGPDLPEPSEEPGSDPTLDGLTCSR